MKTRFHKNPVYTEKKCFVTFLLFWKFIITPPHTYFLCQLNNKDKSIVMQSSVWGHIPSLHSQTMTCFSFIFFYLIDKRNYTIPTVNYFLPMSLFHQIIIIIRVLYCTPQMASDTRKQVYLKKITNPSKYPIVVELRNGVFMNNISL